ncbi:lipid A 3-O-deacylase [Pedobacter sp. CG_S7]|uniref:lipid A deacylase LpxR family protein n=1 Tax=Pedobacter sp. CG_S7 TaxID=3143930 RepID=UPI003396DED8
MKAVKYTLLLSFICFVTSLKAQIHNNEIGLKSDNDSYLMDGRDRYYTNGIFLSFRRALHPEQISEKLEKKILEVSVGQKMYSPISGYSPNPLRQDRPFAGYLYVEAGMNWFLKNESVFKASAEVGTIGPNALAQNGQEMLHRAIGFYEPEGWEYQIRNEMAVNLSAQYTRLLYRPNNNVFDLSFDGYANAGTTFSGAGAAVIIRTGKINQLFNTASTFSVIGQAAHTKPLVKRELFFYTKPQLNFIAYDATIQGSMYKRNSPVTFDSRPFVFAQQLGFNYSSQRFTADFGMVFKTKEIKSRARTHQYGTISLFYRFN